MINKIKEIWWSIKKGYHVYLILFVIFLWAFFMAFAITEGDGNCGKTYVIERCLITNLFCEIKQGEHDE